MATPSQAQKPEVVGKTATPKTFDEAVAMLAKAPKMDNPYEAVVAGESTTQKKNRLRLAHRFETERGKLEENERKATGIAGAYGRVASVIDGFRKMIAKNPEGSFTLEGLASMAEVAFVQANPDRKKSANSSALYCGEITEALRLMGLVTYSPEAETYRTTPALRAMLIPPSQK